MRFELVAIASAKFFAGFSNESGELEEPAETVVSRIVSPEPDGSGLTSFAAREAE